MALSFMETYMAEAATQPGVVSDRQEMLDEIYATRKEQIKQEIRDGGGDPEVLEEVVSDDPLKPESISVEEWGKLSDESKGQLTREETARKETETASAPAVVEPPKKTKIKVDGQEIEIEDDKIREAGIKALQKETAADKRLEEAGRLKAEAEALVAAARNKEQPDLPVGGPTVVERLTDDYYLKVSNAIQYGTAEESAKALREYHELMASRNQSVELTEEQIFAKLAFREDVKWAHDEYKDVFGDPKLKALFLSEEQRLRAAGDRRPYREFYTDIGNGLREWRANIAPAPTAPSPSLTRQERKATVISIPTAAARQAAPQQIKEPTPSDIVDKMRLARHQSV